MWVRVEIATRKVGDTRSCILLAEISQRKMRDHSYSIPSSIVGIVSTFLAVESSLEYINADDDITFWLYVMNKMWLNLSKIRSSAIFGWFNLLDRFSTYFLVDEGFSFLIGWLKTRRSIHCLIHDVVEGISANSYRFHCSKKCSKLFLFTDSWRANR